MTLRELVNTYGANGFVMDDHGNGSSGPKWVEWDEDADRLYGDIQMDELDPYALHVTLNDAARLVTGDQRYIAMYVSDWVSTGTGDNPYGYRVIF